MRRPKADSAQHRIVRSALIALGFMACASLAVAVGNGAARSEAPAGHAPAASKNVVLAAPVTLVDINSASRAQLKALPGIGDAEADKIVAARPYLSKADLVTAKVMAAGPYLSLKNRIIAKQTRKPSGKP